MRRGLTFLAGLLVGVLLVCGAGFTMPELTLKLKPYSLRYVINGEEAKASDRDGFYFNGRSYVPAGFIYKGTTYAPVRFVAEKLGKRVTWSGETGSVEISDPGKISYREISPPEAPREIQDWVENSKEIELAQSYDLGDQTYLLVTRGTKNTAGYSVKITGVEDLGTEVVVKVRYTDPSGMAAQVITYPYNLVVTERVSKPIRFVLENPATEWQYLPRLVGIPHLQHIVAGSPGILLFEPVTANGEVIIRGAARVFEGALSYEFRDEKGALLAKGCGQAMVGGPDWGYFEFSVKHSEIKAAEVFLTLFAISPKDGSHVDTVECRLLPEVLQG